MQHRHRKPREEIARVRRKDAGVSGKSVLMSWNAGLMLQTTSHNCYHCSCCSTSDPVRDINMTMIVTHTAARLGRSTHLLLTGPPRLWTHLLHAVRIIRSRHRWNVETTRSGRWAWREYLSHLLALCKITTE